MKRLNAQTRLFLWLSLFIASSHALFVWINYRADQQRFDSYLENRTQSLRNLFELELGNASMRMLQTASFIAGMPQVQQTFHAGRQAVEAEGGGAGGAQSRLERQRLLALVEPSWQKLRDRFDVRQLHFQFGNNATSFLRVHAVERYGDSLEGVRHTIFNALQHQKETLGFECGRIVCGLRAVVPVFLDGAGPAQQRFIGVLENGTSFRTVLKQLETPAQAHYAVLLSMQHLEATYFPDQFAALKRDNPPVGNYVIEASLHPDIRNHLAQPAIRKLIDTAGETAPISLEIEGRQLAFTAFPLRDYLGSLDSHRAPVGKILAWVDVSAAIAQSQTNVRNNMAYAVAAFLLLELLLYISIGGLTRKLNKVIASQTRRFQDFSESSVDWYWEIDADLRFTFLSPNFEQHSGEKVEIMLGRRCLDLLHNAPGLDKCENILLQHQPFRDYEYCIRSETGQAHWFSISGVPVVDDHGQFAGYRGVGRVITLHKAAEQALQAGKLAAEQASSAKAAFLANMSHEIRTPLNAVLGFARIGLRDSQTDSQRQRWQHVADAGNHLMYVVNDILDFSKIEAGKFSIDAYPCQLSVIIQNACAMVASVAQQKGLQYTQEEECPNLDIWVLCDAARVQQILTNLLSNAVKFTPVGEVRLRIARDGDITYFRVIDTGIGMTPDQVARLFQPFEQADSGISRRFGGTGLGLAISHKLARLMGGEISVETALGHGSAFTLSLPMPETAAQPAVAERIDAPYQQRLQGLRVLAAEDVELNRLVLLDLLEHEGAQATFADNGHQALLHVQIAGPAAFDVVLMDVQMPEMDGLEATQRILAIAPDQVIIGLTAHALREERDKCLAAGMREHVTKPIDADTLVTVILRHAGTHSAAAAQKPPATVAEPAASPKAAPMEWQILLAHFDGRREFVCKLMTSLLANHGNTPDRLHALVKQHDLPALATLAHSLKGLAGNLLAAEVQALAARTNDAARAGNAEAFSLALELAERFRALLQALRQGMEHSE